MIGEENVFYKYSSGLNNGEDTERIEFFLENNNISKKEKQMVETFKVYGNALFNPISCNTFREAIEHIKTQEGKHQIVKYYEWKEV
jgi:hypothetical protein